MVDIINILRSHTFYNAGEFIEIAKGKNEMITTFEEFKRKSIRKWQLQKR